MTAQTCWVNKQQRKQVRSLQQGPKRRQVKAVPDSLKKNLGMGLLNLNRLRMIARLLPGAMGVAYTAVMLEKPRFSCASMVCLIRQGAPNSVSCALHQAQAHFTHHKRTSGDTPAVHSEVSLLPT